DGIRDRNVTGVQTCALPIYLRARYGRNTFGQSCLLARRLIEHGVRLVTVNMFDTVFNDITWDCHADGGSLAVSLNDYRETLCPRSEERRVGKEWRERGCGWT